MANELLPLLVLEIKKFPCLYNTQLPEFRRRKQTIDCCWMLIAKKIGISAEECKKKWQNIRCTFLRSLKPGRKSKIPYYLTEHLQFILPYIKSGSKTDNGNNMLNLDGEQPTHDSEINNDDDEDDGDDDHTFDYPTADNFQIEVPDGSEKISNQNLPQSSCSVRSYSNMSDNSIGRPRKRTHTDVDEAFTTHLSKKISRDRPEERKNDSVPMFSPIHHFMISLLPEFDSMTEDQIRSFKVKVLMMIDEIKNPQSAHASTNCASKNSDN